jgi:acyl-CoA reductase-like NAD-dependent aldehyde dehydrogenase
MSEYKLLINGKLVPGDSEIEVINPSNESVIAKSPRASEKQLNLAVAAAKEAFPAWRDTPIAERRAMIKRIADVLEAHAEEFYRLLSLEVGRPIGESTEEVDYTIEFIRGLADMEIEDEVVYEDEFRIAVQERRPMGVVGTIIPWNFPILLVGFKVPSALLAGNTVVIKPAPTTPLSTLRLGELIADIFPAGVVNIITDDNDLGPVLSAHPDVAKISFTGSCATGKKVMSAAAATMKRLTLEMGGNDPAIIMPGVDLDAVADFIMYAGFTNAGQICNCIKRIYAHADIYDELVAKVAERCEAHVLGDVLEQGVTMGPVQNKAQLERAKSFLEDAKKNGTIVAGGEVLDRPGYFIRPTVVRDITDGCMLVDEEQFAPIMPFIKFTDVEDALARANASQYALGASIWTPDIDLGNEIAGRMESGMIWVNDHGWATTTTPFVGAKQSGIGAELGLEGLLAFTQLHVVYKRKQLQYGHL